MWIDAHTHRDHYDDDRLPTALDALRDEAHTPQDHQP